MQAQLKNVAKAPVVSNDTLFITEDDLPYVADMRLSTTAVVALQLSQAKELVVSVSADNKSLVYTAPPAKGLMLIFR